MPSPKNHWYELTVPPEILSEPLNVYCGEHMAAGTAVKSTKGLGKRVSVCTKVGPGHPGTNKVVQEYVPGWVMLMH